MGARLFPALSQRSGRLVLLSIGTALGGIVPACLPDITFDPASTSSDGGAEGSSSDAISPTDAARDGTAIDGASVDSGDASPGVDADPNAIGPFAENLDSDYFDTAVCAVRGGTLYCWGGPNSNPFGELGLPEDLDTDASYPLPTPITMTAAPASQITQIAPGAVHSCTLYGRKTYCRGNNEHDELGDSTAATGPSEVEVLGLPAGGLDMLASASATTCGLTLTPPSGSVSNVYCWGTNGEGELGRDFTLPQTNAAAVVGIVDGGPTGAISDATTIAGGGDHFCVVSASRGILCWGGSDYYQTGPIQGPSSCPGDAITCSVQPQPVTLPAADGGAPEVPIGLALGIVHSCAVTQGGNVYCWGWDYEGQLGPEGAGVAQSCENGSMQSAPCSGVPIRVTGFPNPIRTIRAGGYSTCALDTMGHAWCWGYDSDGELGNGPPPSATPPALPHSATPLVVLDPDNGAQPIVFDDLTVGYEGACGRQGDALYCWGSGALGTSLPDASAPSFLYPAQVIFP